VLFALVRTYSLSQPMGPAVYGAGFVVATLLSVAAGSLTSPARLSRIIVPVTCALAVLFPVGLNVYCGVVAHWQPVFLLYLLGSIWGGYAIAWLASPVAGIQRLHHA
jgi:hypothetical protein